MLHRKCHLFRQTDAKSKTKLLKNACLVPIYLLYDCFSFFAYFNLFCNNIYVCIAYIVSGRKITMFEAVKQYGRCPASVTENSSTVAEIAEDKSLAIILQTRSFS